MTGSAAASSRTNAEDYDVATPSRPRRRGWRGWLSDLVATDLPGAIGAAVLVIVAAALWGWRSAEQLLPGAFWRSWSLVFPDVVAAVGVGVVGGTVVVLLGRLHKWRLPWLFLCALVLAAVLLFTMGAGASLIGWMAVAVVTLAAAALGGWCLGAALGHRQPRHPALRWSGFGVTSVAAVVLVGYLLWPGPGAAAPAAVTTTTSITDPAAPGSYRVVSTAYGSGSDHANPTYGPGVPIRTDPVDGSAVIGGWRQDSTRSGVWGFTAATLPLDALVWAPEGPGPFPLVLILHGNTAFDDSEAGFAYLGSRLASRGYLVASLDEGFLNTGLLDKSNPISGAANARAWLILAHLHQWKMWNERAGNPFTGKVDLADVSLIGHSRGGEAVTLAAARGQQLAALGRSAPDPGIHIRTVIALAPSDGQPGAVGGAEPVHLDNTNFLTLGGTYDADVGTFAGARQYARTTLRAGLVKAAVSIGRANHTQFNSRWGRYDVGFGAAKYLLHTAALLTPEQQRQATTAYVSAFLDLTIKKRSGLRALFDGQATGASWLPRTTYVQQYADGPSMAIQDFEPGGDINRTSIGRVQITGSPRAVRLPTRTGPSTNFVVPLTWSPGGKPAQYSISSITRGALPAGAVLTADIADAGTNPIPVQVTVTDAAGHSGTVPFGGHPDVPPLPTGSVLKPLLPGGSVSEPLLQTFRLPLTSVTGHGVDPTTITALTITLGDRTGGSLYLDNVGISMPSTVS